MRAPRLSSPAAGILTGLATGIADAVIVHYDFAWALKSVHYEPPFTWIAVLWVWMTAGCLAGILFSSPRLGRLRAIPLAFAGPGLLLLSRTAAYVKDVTHWPASRVLAALALVTLVLAIPISRIRFEPARELRRYAAATLVSIAAILFCAASVRLHTPARTSRPADPAQRSVVLIFLDTVRYDDALQMPQLAAFSRQALTFDNAWAPSSWTVPSHFAMLTGLDPWTVPFARTPRRYDTNAPYLAQRFRARGYDTGAVFSNYLLSPGAGFARGFDDFRYSREARVCLSAFGNLASRVWLYDLPPSPLCGMESAKDVTKDAREFLSRARRPYFLAVNYMDAHDPYYVPPECREANVRPISRAERLAVVDAKPERKPPRAEVVRRVRGQYRAVLQCIDRSLGELLRDAQRDPNTVIAVVGDHGEQFGEHGLGWHGNSLYGQLLHVPLMVKGPGLAPGRVAEAVSITDLHRTLLTLADPSRAREPLALLDARRPVISYLDRTHSRIGGFSIVRGDLHLIRERGGHEELFDVRRDPGETRQVTAPREVVDPMRDAAIRASRSQKSHEGFRSLGYLR